VQNPQDSKPVSPDQHTGKPARGLPRSVQLIAVAIAAGGLFVGVLGKSLLFPAETAPPKPEAVTEAAYTTPTFHPTPEQWAAFAITEVKPHSFEAARRTDGQIAIDDDLSTPVYSPYSGRVTRVIAKPGEVVKPGQPLFAIQATEFVQAQNDLVAAVAALRTARAQLRMAQTSEKRQHDLYSAQGGSLKDWQQSQVDLATAQGTLDSANVALGAVRGRLRILGKTDAEIAVMEEHPEHATVIPEVEVGAPIGGTVIQRQIGVGQNIVSATTSSGGGTPVYTIGDLSKVWLIANVREAETGEMKLGHEVQVRVLAFPDRVFTAHITYVAPSIDPNTRRLPVRAEIDNPDFALKPQMFASFTILTGAPTLSPAVPERGVVFEGQKAHVWVANEADKTLELRQVRTGSTANGLVEVVEGLKPGEHVVTTGAVFIDRAIETD
jgi:cobalt-zinc-cadmium efflux system membrane fusion protein